MRMCYERGQMSKLVWSNTADRGNWDTTAGVSMTDADVIAAIREKHLKANIDMYEGNKAIYDAKLHWDRAWVDPGGTIFGLGPYVKLPVTFWEWGQSVTDEVTIRVYPPARLRRRLTKLWTVNGYPHVNRNVKQLGEE